VNTNSIEGRKINSGFASTARSNRIQKDRQRRPAEEMRRNGEKPSDSNSHQEPGPDPHVFSDDTQEDIDLRNELEVIFQKTISFPQKNQSADVKEQGKRIDVII
jgi:hypothetical protein